MNSLFADALQFEFLQVSEVRLGGVRRKNEFPGDNKKNPCQLTRIIENRVRHSGCQPERFLLPLLLPKGIKRGL